MRVACPECTAEYDLPPTLAARLEGGKTVRCARCGTTWSPRLSAPESRAPEDPAPESLAPADPPSGPPPESPLGFPDPPPAAVPPPAPEPAASPVGEAADTSRFVILAWAASLLLLLGAAAAAWTWRIDLVEAWPPAARAFIALGLAS